MIHNDPIDRIIVATAPLMGARILTPDKLILSYKDISVLW